MLADELFLLLEGGRVAAQSMSPKGLGDRLVRMGEAMIKAHTIIWPRSVNCAVTLQPCSSPTLCQSRSLSPERLPPAS
jgi:hypothetical protein